MRKIDSRNNGRATGRSYRIGLVMGHSFTVQREPIAQARKLIREIQGSVASAGIKARALQIACIVEADEAPSKCAKGQRRYPLAGEDCGPRKSEFKVLGGLKADLVAVHVGIGRKMMTGQLD